jgi:hypothetical protein
MRVVLAAVLGTAIGAAGVYVWFRQFPDWRAERLEMLGCVQAEGRGMSNLTAYCVEQGFPLREEQQPSG